jgi:hypothetical protein
MGGARWTIFAAAAALFMCAPALADAVTYPTCFEERAVVEGLTAPTGMAWARWMDARLASTSGDVEWLLDLGKRLPRGSYRVLVRARDTAGNVSELPLRRASLVKVGPSRP